MTEKPPSIEDQLAWIHAHARALHPHPLWAAVIATLESCRWRPIAEAPKDGTKIDFWCVHPHHEARRSPDMRWDAKQKEWFDDFWPLNPGWTPTHWRPLPPPPEDPR